MLICKMLQMMRSAAALAVLLSAGYAAAGVSGWNWEEHAVGTPAVKSWRALAASGDISKIYGSGYEEYLFVTLNGGSNWTPRLPGGDWGTVSCSADGSTVVGGMLPGGAYFSTDSASSFNQLEFGGNYWLSSAASGDGSLLVLGEYRGSLWLSKDNGATWAQAAGLPGGDDSYWSAAACSNDGTTVAAAEGSSGNIYVSNDKGATWKTTVTLPVETATPQICLTVSNDGKTIIAISSKAGVKVRISKDGGEAWIESAPAGTDDIPFTRLAASGNGATVLLSGGGSADDGRIWRSTDTGATWTEIPLPEDTSHGAPSSLAVSDDGSKFLAGMNQLHYSNDGGATWDIFDNTGCYWTDCAFSGDGSNAFCVGDGVDGIMRSKDYGQTWSTLNSGNPWTAVGCSPDARVIVAGNGTDGLLYISQDAGATWSAAAKLDPSYWVSVGVSNDGNLIAACSGSNIGVIAVSKDLGKSWKVYKKGAFWWSCAVSADGSTVLACSAAGQLVVSRDQGSKWTDITPDGVSNKLSGVACSADGDKIFLSSYSGPVYASLDGGATWSVTNLQSLQWEGIACSASGQMVMAIAAFDYPYASIDFGRTWNKINPSGTNTVWKSCRLSSDGNRALLAVFAGNVFTGKRDIPAGKTTFSVYVHPPAGGTTNPSGCTEVAIGEKFAISAVPAAGYAFAGWALGYGCRLDDLFSANTNAVCGENAYVTAIFSKAQVNVESLKASYYSANASKEKLSVTKGDIPELPPDFNPETAVAQVRIGNTVISCTPQIGAWTSSNKGYVFKSDKKKPFKLQLTLDTKAKKWSLKANAYPLGTPTDMSRAVVGLSVNGYTFASFQQLTGKSSWSYKGPKKIVDFQVGALKGSTGSGAGAGSLSVKPASIPQLVKGFGDVSLAINDLKIDEPASSFTAKGQVYTYKGQTAGGDTALVFDLAKKTWSLKISKGTLADIARRFGIADISLKVGDNDLLKQTVNTVQSTTLEKKK